jgi:hypothetical protein
MFKTTGDIGMKWGQKAGALFGAAVLGLGLMSGAAMAAGALHVEESTTLDAPPAAVWQLIGKFSSMGWHPVVAETTLTSGKDQQKGALRSVKTKDGAVIVEKLLAYDAGRHSMRYAIQESPLPVAHYVSTLSVQPAGKGSRVVWKSDFDAVRSEGVDDAKAKDIIAGIYKAGLGGLREKLQGQ